jgi:dTDP-4-dehydrorhamnose 3,5-epimerase
MIITATSLPGVFTIDVEPIQDARGFFARAWDRKAFEAHGLDHTIVHGNLSWNRVRGTLRGLHYQLDPFSEVKLVRCTRGAILDVVADLRPASPGYRRWVALELTAVNHRALYVPKGFAHGYLTLADDVEVYYHVSAPYSAAYARGVRWNDPALGIEWPFEPSVLSDQDRAWPSLVP